MTKEKIVVIGTNHAGTYAVSTLADNYKQNADVITYDSNNNISFLGCGMALWIGGVIDSSDGLFYASPQSLEEKGVEVHMEHLVENVDTENKQITVKDNEGNTIVQEYDKLIIAVGSWPIKPNIPGIDLENVIYAKLFQHAEHAKELMANEEIKSVAVVGGGYIGVELVEAFKENGKEAFLITDGDVLNRYFDQEFTSKMSERLVAHGIEMHENERVEEILGTDKVEGIKTDKGTYQVDAVLMSVGFNANTKFLSNSGIETNERGVIIVDNQQQTNIEDVYAIGDCATIASNATHKGEHIALATNAVRSGIVAAHNAGGLKISHNGVQGSNAIHIYGLTLTSTGLNSEAAKLNGYNIDSVCVTDTIRADFMPTNENVTIKIVWDKDTLKILGAQIMSEQDISLAIHMFSLAIEVGYTIDKLATLDLFFLPHFNKPENFITKAGLLALNKVLTY
ncbi:FAD-dependent oxidoreductase [Mollicutes bacterium LVI A0039]|nr:FAD-dependent oxidoreductase [Mollicutes bacterium LVI A0039]